PITLVPYARKPAKGRDGSRARRRTELRDLAAPPCRSGDARSQRLWYFVSVTTAAEPTGRRRRLRCFLCLRRNHGTLCRIGGCPSGCSRQAAVPATPRERLLAEQARFRTLAPIIREELRAGILHL